MRTGRPGLCTRACDRVSSRQCLTNRERAHAALWLREYRRHGYRPATQPLGLDSGASGRADRNYSGLEPTSDSLRTAGSHKAWRRRRRRHLDLRVSQGTQVIFRNWIILRIRIAVETLWVLQILLFGIAPRHWVFRYELAACAV